MNILILLPPNTSGGNWTYSGRLQKGLAPKGIQITRKTLDEVTEQDYKTADIVHAYNAYMTGRHMVADAKRYGKPLVLTMTGTDVNEHLNHPETRPSMVEVVEYASKIVFLTEAATGKLASVYPSAAHKSVVINLGIDLPSGQGKTRADFGFGDDEFIFLLVAGLRSVKRPLDAFAPLARVHKKHPQVRFLLAGQPLDTAMHERVQQTFEGSGFARYIGTIPYDEISDLYRASDVAMNTSSSEGLSHALLEAMSLGKPILASNVPGNDDLIVDGVNGFLYSNADEFVAKAELLYTDAATRERVRQGALQTIADHYSLSKELTAFCQMYHEVLNRENRPCTV